MSADRIQKNDLTEGRISTTLLRFAVPFLITSLLQAFYGAVDLFVVGQFADSAAVSAVAIGSQVMQTITGIVLGIAMGGTVLIGRCIGQKNERGAAKGIGSLTVLFAVTAAVLTPVMMIFTDGIVSIMETPPQAVGGTVEYIFTCSAGILFIIGYNGVSGVYRGMGDSKTPVYFVIIACIINVGLDFLLIGYFHMGAWGAAFATVMAQAVSFIAILIYMIRKGLGLKIEKSDFIPEAASVKQILIVGLPLALQDGLVNISFLIMTAIINTMGLVASAAVGVVEKIIVFAMIPPTAAGSAVAAMSAQNLGAGNRNRSVKTLYCGIGFALVFGVAACVYAHLLPEALTGIFSNDPDVIKAGADYLRPYSIDCIMVSFIFCMNGYFSSCQKSVVSFVHSMIATFGFRVPGTYILNIVTAGNLAIIGYAPPIASVSSLIICFAYFKWIMKKGPLQM
ncbi:MAG: MATE family efflux transporter [Eubacteriaceae bacterium]|nr:MATE family efflux transporter [Eubacteriaceae bacterium]